MKTETEINKLAAEAMGIECWHSTIQIYGNEWSLKRRCGKCHQDLPMLSPVNPDFVNDLNAAQRLLGLIDADDEDVWRLFEDVFEVYLHDNPNLNGGDLIELFRDTTARKLTLAILAALGKITFEEAKECLNNDN